MTELAATSDVQIAVPPAPSSRTAVLRDVIALAKPRIMVMTLLTAAGAASLAPGRVDPTTIALMLIGTGLIVGAANAFNMYIERDIDCLMARTKSRPLPQRRLSPATARRFGAVLHALALPVLLAVNPLTAVLGLVAMGSYVFLYTPLKQKTHWATWVGAVPGAMPVLMGWAAATGTIDLAGLAVFSVLFFWQIPHFHAIALYRQREYERAGLKTLPSARGERAALIQIGVFLVVQVAASLTLPLLGVTGMPYLIVACVLGAFVLIQGVFPLILSEHGAKRRAQSKDGIVGGGPKWARQVFLASLVYLPVLFVTMVLDGRL
jgi:protoheme IX farnesyltransferase